MRGREREMKLRINLLLSLPIRGEKWGKTIRGGQV